MGGLWITYLTAVRSMLICIPYMYNLSVLKLKSLVPVIRQFDWIIDFYLRKADKV